MTIQEYYNKPKMEQLEAWRNMVNVTDALHKMGFFKESTLDAIYCDLLDIEPHIEWYPEYDSYYEQYDKYQDNYYYCDWLDSEHNDISAHYERKDNAHNRYHINVKCKRDVRVASHKSNNYSFKKIGTHKGSGKYY